MEKKSTSVTIRHFSSEIWRSSLQHILPTCVLTLIGRYLGLALQEDCSHASSKVICEEENDKIVGTATTFGIFGSDLLLAFTFAMMFIIRHYRDKENDARAYTLRAFIKALTESIVDIAFIMLTLNLFFAQLLKDFTHEEYFYGVYEAILIIAINTPAVILAAGPLVNWLHERYFDRHYQSEIYQQLLDTKTKSEGKTLESNDLNLTIQGEVPKQITANPITLQVFYKKLQQTNSSITQPKILNPKGLNRPCCCTNLLWAYNLITVILQQMSRNGAIVNLTAKDLSALFPSKTSDLMNFASQLTVPVTVLSVFYALFLATFFGKKTSNKLYSFLTSKSLQGIIWLGNRYDQRITERLKQKLTQLSLQASDNYIDFNQIAKPPLKMGYKVQLIGALCLFIIYDIYRILADAEASDPIKLAIMVNMALLGVRLLHAIVTETGLAKTILNCATSLFINKNEEGGENRPLISPVVKYEP